VALKQAVGTDLIREREERFLRRALDRWRRNPNLELLGIQARGGCSCAGPYGHRLLGIDPDRSRP
jgi:selenocysteine lyase/cysteine desulfurase